MKLSSILLRPSSMLSLQRIVFTLGLLVGTTSGFSSTKQYEYPPHRYVRSPWFEGWYTRVTLADWSLAFVIGHLPNQTTAPNPAAACLLLVSNTSDPSNSTTTPQSYFQFFSGLNITNGRCGTQSKAGTAGVVTGCKEYDTMSGGDVERDFVLTGANGTVDQRCEMRYEGQRLTLHGVFADIEVRLEMEHGGEFTPWAPDHTTEGWLPHSLTRLHWYVHSLSTPVRVWFHPYSGGGDEARRAASSQAGVAHLEKNWGESFPPNWLWAQGHAVQEEDGAQTTQAAFALAGGPLPTAVESLSIYAFSYYSPSFNASIDPWNPPLWFTLKQDACAGTVNLTLYSLKYTVEVTSSAPVESFTPVWAPTTDGFQVTAVESYTATTEVKVYSWGTASRFPWSSGTSSKEGSQSWVTESRPLLAHFVFNSAALEFGGTNRCSKQANKHHVIT